MRIFKKITSLVVAFALAFSVSSSVFAEFNNSIVYGSQYYRVIHPSTGTETIIDANNLPFTGTTVSSSMQAPIQPFNIIGDDDREVVTNTTIAPYKSIAYVKVINTDNIGVANAPFTRGTAVAFATNAIITAAHVIEGNSIPKDKMQINIYFGRNGGNDSDTHITIMYNDLEDIYIPTGYTSYPDNADDCAILKFSDNIISSNSIMGYTTGMATKNSAVTVCGYPTQTSGISGGLNPDFRQWKASGTITYSQPSYFRYNADTTGGQSGSPVYATSNGNYYIVGIQASGNATYNVAKRVDQSLFNIMDGIRNGTY
jgi:V8-like Glu-specific endopeptidase